MNINMHSLLFWVARILEYEMYSAIVCASVPNHSETKYILPVLCDMSNLSAIVIILIVIYFHLVYLGVYFGVSLFMTMGHKRSVKSFTTSMFIMGPKTFDYGASGY